MKEKWYFCSWWDNMKMRKKVTFFLSLAIVNILASLALMYFLGNFSVSDYPEDTYKSLEEAYLPYVHEGVGIDLIGLKKAVHGLGSPIVYNDEIQIRYGYTTKYVTITLDKNYKTTKIERNAKTESEYAKIATRSNIVFLIGFPIIICFSEALLGVGAHLISLIHKLFDKSRAKHKKKP